MLIRAKIKEIRIRITQAIIRYPIVLPNTSFIVYFLG